MIENYRNGIARRTQAINRSTDPFHSTFFWFSVKTHEQQADEVGYFAKMVILISTTHLSLVRRGQLVYFFYHLTTLRGNYWHIHYIRQCVCESEKSTSQNVATRRNKATIDLFCLTYNNMNEVPTIVRPTTFCHCACVQGQLFLIWQMTKWRGGTWRIANTHY